MSSDSHCGKKSMKSRSKVPGASSSRTTVTAVAVNVIGAADILVIQKKKVLPGFPVAVSRRGLLEW